MFISPSIQTRTTRPHTRRRSKHSTLNLKTSHGTSLLVVVAVFIPSCYIIFYIIRYFIAIRCTSYQMVMITALPLKYKFITSGIARNSTFKHVDITAQRRDVPWHVRITTLCRIRCTDLGRQSSSIFIIIRVKRFHFNYRMYMVRHDNIHRNLYMFIMYLWIFQFIIHEKSDLRQVHLSIVDFTEKMPFTFRTYRDKIQSFIIRNPGGSRRFSILSHIL